MKAFFEHNFMRLPVVGGGAETVNADAQNRIFSCRGFIVSLLALALACLAALPAAAQFTYTVSNGAATITSYNTAAGLNVVVPASINGYPVTAVGYSAFFSQSAITNVTIPNSVTTIGSYAFYFCSGLASMTIPNSVIIIGDDSFERCDGLTSVTIPNSVTTIGQYAFHACSGLTSVTIPNSVTIIDRYAFADCFCLTNIAVNPANPSYASAGGVMFDKTLTTLIQCPGGLTGSYAIPNSVTSIGDEALESCSSLTNVTIPNSVTTIGQSAFYWCSGLTNVTIGNSVTTIGDYAFEDCRGLTSVMIPNSVTTIGTFAFKYCFGLTKAFFQGNAPLVNGVAGSADTTVFQTATAGTVYYLPGTTGWGSTFGGWPTAQWYQPQPQILGYGNGLGAQSNKFGFTISWATNTSVVVLASTNLQTWTPLITNTLTGGTNYFSDSKWTNYPNRFYRVRSQ